MAGAGLPTAAGRGQWDSQGLGCTPNPSLEGATSGLMRAPPSSSTPWGCVPEVGGSRGRRGRRGPLQGPLPSEPRMVGSTQRVPGPGGARCPLRAARPPAGVLPITAAPPPPVLLLFSSSSPRRLATAAARAGGAAVIPAPEEPALAGAWGSGRGETRAAGVTQQVEPGPRPATRPPRASCSSLSPLSPPGQNPEHDGRQ